MSVVVHWQDTPCKGGNHRLRDRAIPRSDRPLLIRFSTEGLIRKKVTAESAEIDWIGQDRIRIRLVFIFANLARSARIGRDLNGIGIGFFLIYWFCIGFIPVDQLGSDQSDPDQISFGSDRYPPILTPIPIPWSLVGTMVVGRVRSPYSNDRGEQVQCMEYNRFGLESTSSWIHQLLNWIGLWRSRLKS